MSVGWAIPAGTYLGLGLVAFHAWRHPGSPSLGPGARTGWFAGWLAVSALAVARGLTSASPLILLTFGLLPASWAMAADLSARVWRVPRLVPWAGAVLASVGAAVPGGGVMAGLAAGAGVSLAGVLTAARDGRKWRPVRLGAWWLSFTGTFAGLLPVALAEHSGTLALAHPGVGAVLGGLGVALTVWATRDLTRGVGTPDPWDPPERLVTTGLYARLRHPMQLAHCLIVWGAALALGGPGPLVLAAVFTAVLLGPARIAEERGLAARYGEAFHQYRARVRAYCWTP